MGCAAIALGAIAGCGGKKHKAIGAQMYSMRNEITQNGYKSVLADLAECGYTSVETASYDDEQGLIYGDTPENFKAECEKLGITPVSCHISHALTQEELDSGNFTQALKWWDKAIDVHRRAGMSYIVCPWFKVPDNLQQLLTYCNYFNEIGRRVKDAGMQFGYHNHSHEFEKVEEQVVYDFMLEHTDADHVFFEMDVYWAVMGKASPVEYFKKYPGRFALLHIKDKYEIGGSGMVGFDAIFRNAEAAGLKGIVVEQEAAEEGTTMKEGMAASVKYLDEAPFVKAAY